MLHKYVKIGKGNILMKKILLTGVNGFVGNKIKNMYPEEIVEAPSLRNATEDDVKRIVVTSNADVIVHTAAVSDIAACQKDADTSYYANVLLPVYLAKAAEGEKLVCFSSDQVYSGSDGDGPYAEEDAKPMNLYAEQKLEMEQRVLDICPDSVLLRAQWMYDFVSPKGNYFINVLSGQTSFSTKQFRGISYVKEVAELIPKVFAFPGGVYNFGCETDMSIYQITKLFLQFIGSTDKVQDAPERHNLWMDCSKAKKLGLKFSDVMVGLENCWGDYEASKFLL